MKRTKLKNGTKVIETAHPFEGLPNGGERLAKARLAMQINERIRERGIKQKEAAELLGITNRLECQIYQTIPIRSQI